MKKKDFSSINIETPNYDAADWGKKEKVNYYVRLWQLVYNQPSRDFPSDDDLREQYASLPEEIFKEKLADLEERATEIKLKQHRKKQDREKNGVWSFFRL